MEETKESTPVELQEEEEKKEETVETPLQKRRREN